MSIRDFWALTRFEHSIMLAIAVLVGEVVALGGLPDERTLVLSILPPMLVGAASFSINDYFDLRSDRINKRVDRPLVRGSVKPRTALLLSLPLFLAGIAISALLNFNCFVIVLLFSLMATLYSFKLKDIALMGNIYIAASMAVPFLYGSLAVTNQIPQAVLLLGSLAFVSGLAREIMGTVRDVRGDRVGRGSRTLPMLIGVRNSLIISSLLYLVSIVLSIIPYLYLPPYAGNIFYGLPVFTADAILIYILIGSFSNSSGRFMKMSRNLSLLAMFIALLGFLGGVLR